MKYSLCVLAASFLISGKTSAAVCKSENGKQAIAITQEPGLIILWNGNIMIDEFGLVYRTDRTEMGVENVYDFLSIRSGKRIQANITNPSEMGSSTIIRIDAVIYLCK